MAARHTCTFFVCLPCLSSPSLTPHSEIIKLPPGALKGLKEGKADDMLAVSVCVVCVCAHAPVAVPFATVGNCN